VWRTITTLALLFMSNKIIGKNYSLSFILVNGYINRLNPIHKHTFDLICLYNHLMIYKYSVVFFINIDRCPSMFKYLFTPYYTVYSPWSRQLLYKSINQTKVQYPNTCNFTVGKKRDFKNENITLNDRHNININPLLQQLSCLSIIILVVHWCCCSELIVHTNTEITVECLLSDMFGTMQL
jgi:hypothetical protein